MPVFTYTSTRVLFRFPFSHCGIAYRIFWPHCRWLPLAAVIALLFCPAVALAETTGSAAVNTTSAPAAQKRWNQLGTVRAQFTTDDDVHSDGGALDLWGPLYHSGDTLVFTQLGGRRRDSRNTLNPGVGVRLVTDNWLYGINAFFDDDITGENRRVGFGAELWTHYVKLSSNVYYRITDERHSADLANTDERPANGYDLRGEAYLPFFPQLGAEMIFEKYYGEGVALFNKNVRLDSPRALTVGLSYTPIPLVTLAANRRAGSADQAENRFSVQINYRLGQSWREQCDPGAVAAIRSLAVSRYDLVERNSNGILDYQRRN